MSSANVTFRPFGLIASPVLYGSYLRASKLLRQSSTVLFWENILNHYVASTTTAVNSQQPTDDTTKAVDIVVKYYDQAFDPIIAAIVECKRVGSRSSEGRKTVKSKCEIEDMESQLQGYVQFFFEKDGGLARRPFVLGAVIFGTKIRAWRFDRISSGISQSAFWGGEEEDYKDAGDPADAMEILEFFNAIKKAISDDMQQGSGYTVTTPSVSGYNIPTRPVQPNMGPGYGGSLCNSSQPMGAGAGGYVYNSSQAPGAKPGGEVGSDEEGDGEGDEEGTYNTADTSAGDMNDFEWVNIFREGLCQG